MDSQYTHIIAVLMLYTGLKIHNCIQDFRNISECIKVIKLCDLYAGKSSLMRRYIENTFIL